MLQERELKTRSAGGYGYAAAVDAGRYSDECRILYTPKQRAHVSVFGDILSLAYKSDETYITFRKKFVSLKLVNAQVSDTRMLKELDLLCAERGYEKISTEQGLTYRITP